MDRVEYGKKYLELLLVIGEILVAIIISITVIIASFQTFVMLGSMVKVSIPNKSTILELIDTAILLLLALDLLRTVIIGIMEKEIPIKNIIEAAMIVIVREMIVNTLENSSPIYLIYLSLSFVMVSVSMIFIMKYSKS
ncbi:Phosphate-starvation-inducible E [Caldisphaera lagunensis DSM 15908]|uniref:Phosphate-starvation-inducible E n=1 Tax=Caldisphaera lagunensis (strain DSM 15908 / JCM 11604 / ANMR 0165 / IC-154) TaxID=1056495 RepID=L0AA71_CALLD|nr:phosphate-starvation-inducible PsiE family protein [Caldisphaera lagunensis]AFZ70022.1 Phosphate-starvation-inducible E [Caldisphaera lagunensis DSM 15908]